MSISSSVYKSCRSSFSEGVGGGDNVFLGGYNYPALSNNNNNIGGVNNNYPSLNNIGGFNNTYTSLNNNNPVQRFPQSRWCRFRQRAITPLYGIGNVCVENMKKIARKFLNLFNWLEDKGRWFLERIGILDEV